MKDPRKLLNSIVNLISKDIKEIKKSVGKLEAGYAGDLVKYSKALLEIISDQDHTKDIEKEKLAKMSSQELKALATKVLTKKDNENQ